MPDNLLTLALECADSISQEFIVVQMAGFDSLIEVIQRLVAPPQLALEVRYCLAPCIALIRRSLRQFLEDHSQALWFQDALQEAIDH
ncbi:hypothetical protein [Limibacillus sp. MBR-115]|uniref:hypothetical protein n=1 Tax=Limibacillus sp. MBR-115 TaxID=3156465 RepID=UPI00339A4641